MKPQDTHRFYSDPTYAKYVKRFGQIGAKAFSTKEEHDAFEAVRTLTIVKESPTSTLMKLRPLKML